MLISIKISRNKAFFSSGPGLELCTCKINIKASGLLPYSPAPQPPPFSIPPTFLVIYYHSIQYYSILFFYSILFYPLTLEGRRGTTGEFATIPFQPFLFSAALAEMAKSISVQSLMLSSYLFFCLPLFLFPSTVACLQDCLC